jgi:murein DD-endopeptidase MepM/ murein hydrolase activator NlpD
MKIVFTSRFLDHEAFRNKPHSGVDVALKEGTPLKAVEDGVIRLADYGDKNAGKTVFLETEEGTFIYGHLKDFLVKDGQTVREGQTIALSGNTGHSTGPHLHLGLKDESGQYIDPTPYADEAVNGGSWFDKFIENGQIDAYEPIVQSLPDFLASLATSHFILLAGLIALLFNRYTRIYSIVGLLLLAII